MYADPAVRQALATQFAGTERISVLLAPPLISRSKTPGGRPVKRKFGPWVFTAFAPLSRLKFLRGSRADPFGRTHERRAERALRDEYITMIETLCDGLDRTGLDHGKALASLPDMVRGYGPVKQLAISEYRAERAAM